MKGLILTHTGKRQEGVDLVRKGIRQDLTSHIVWHVYGLVQKADKDYEGALKSYQQALRFDEHNQNILRDAAALQAQLRHFDGLVESRRTLLSVRPNLRQNWIGLALALSLSGDNERAVSVLEKHEGSLKNVPANDYEHSELLLFHLRILALDDPRAALQFLRAHESDIVDTISKLLYRARLLTELNDPDAPEAWRALVDRNPDSRDYIAALIANADPLPILNDLITAHPRASAPRELALIHSSGPTFADLARHHLSSNLSKGVPSLFATTKPLLSDPEKLSTIRDIALDIKRSVSSTEPTLYLWTTYFLAQLTSYSAKYRTSSSTQQDALDLVEEATAHTPTLPELWTLRGKILKRMGDPHGAVDAVQVARDLDGQDRFLNWKSAKYMLRAGYIDRAHAVFGLFTKVTHTSSP